MFVNVHVSDLSPTCNARPPPIGFLAIQTHAVSVVTVDVLFRGGRGRCDTGTPTAATGRWRSIPICVRGGPLQRCRSSWSALDGRPGTFASRDAIWSHCGHACIREIQIQNKRKHRDNEMIRTDEQTHVMLLVEQRKYVHIQYCVYATIIINTRARVRVCVHELEIKI